MSDQAIVCTALCRNHLSGFAEPCAEACITGAGVAFECEHAGEVWGSDAQEILRALKQEGSGLRSPLAPYLRETIDDLSALKQEGVDAGHPDRAQRGTPPHDKARETARKILDSGEALSATNAEIRELAQAYLDAGHRRETA